MSTITNLEATILGLIIEGPKHAYEVEKVVEERDMRHWTEVSMSSIYKTLRKLEEKGLLTSTMKLSDRNKSQRVYEITDTGRALLGERVRELTSVWHPPIFPLDIGLTNFGVLDRDEQLEALENYRASVQGFITCYRELEEFLSQHCGPADIALARRRLFLLDAEIRWVDDLVGQLKKDDEGTECEERGETS
jgi:DNA-binding PadR family transcriptional regulator